jgi:uncharacterized protein YecE (DUF72 family)
MQSENPSLANRKNLARPYFIGCPAWAYASWKGRFFSQKAKSQEFLGQYSSVFNTVEGNTTFYGIPKASSIVKWREHVPKGFRFCFKFPQWISHRRPFSADTKQAEEFLKTMEPLREFMGPVFLQIPASTGPESLSLLRGFFSRLPQGFQYALEPRHPDFFDSDKVFANELNEMLGELEVDRVIFETRPLFESQFKDAATIEAQRKKPREAPMIVTTGVHPIVRFVGNLEPEILNAYLEKWTSVFAAWIQEGKRPSFMAHTPDDVEAPELAKKFDSQLISKLPNNIQIQPPIWPCELERQSSQSVDTGEKQIQLNLFN